MLSPKDFPARGTVSEVGDRRIIFRPVDTNYQLRLQMRGEKYEGPVNRPVDCLIRLMARKVWTVRSGGTFITPISGEPRIIQGRVRYADDRTIVLHAGTSLVIDLPGLGAAFDLASGAIEVGAMVNVTALPGANFELLAPALKA